MMNNNSNNNSINWTKNCTREQDREVGKVVQCNQNLMTMTTTSTATTTTTTTYQQPPRCRFPEHSTIGTLRTSSTSCQWNKNINNNNCNSTTYNNKSLPISSSWVNDPEIKRQRRIVRYKAYAVEGKMKSSIRSGLRWVKNKYCQLVHGY